MKLSTGLRVVIVNGKPGVGKTTFEDACIDILGHAYGRKRSTIDKIKEIAKSGGWLGEKDPRSRKLLSDLKDLFTEYNDLPNSDIYFFLRGWEDDIQYYYVGNHPHVLFVDAREPEEIEKLKKDFNAITVIVRRPGDEKLETSNHADENVFNYEYDYVIENDGDLGKLKDEAQRFLNSIFS